MPRIVSITPKQESGYGQHRLEVASRLQGHDLHYTLSVLEWSQTVRASRSTFHHPTPVISRLFYFTKGEGKITMNGRTTTLSTNTLHLIPPMPFTITYFPSVLNFIHLQIQHPFGWDFLQLRDPTILHDPKLEKRMQESSTPWAHILMHLPQTLLPPMSERLDTIAHGNQLKSAFAPLLSWMESMPPAHWSVEMAAKQLHETRSALSKRFQRKFGMPLKQFFIEQHISAAQNRLKGSGQSIEEIAIALGHGSPQAFQRFFKQHVGTPPRRWAQQNQP